MLSNDRGEAKFEFELPDNLTTYRVMVIAHTRASEFGAAQTDITVSQPLILLTSSPRFVRVGDRFRAGVVVTNNSGKGGRCEVNISAQGVKLLGANGSAARLAAGESREFTFAFSAESAGRAQFRAAAKLSGGAGEFSDGVQWSIPVQVPRRPVMTAVFGRTDSTAEQRLEIPENIFPGSDTLEVRLAATALLGLHNSLQYLSEYPYGCLEQRLSRILPLLVSQRLRAAWASTNSLDVQQVVSRTLEELAAFQRYDGGFSLWRSGTESRPFLSAYAAWVLVEAQRNGFTPPRQMLGRAIQYLQQILRRPFREQQWSWSGRAGYLSSRALAYYVLGLAGRRDVNYAEPLFAERNDMPLFARAFLLRALARHGAPQRMQRTLAVELSNLVRLEARTAHFEESNEKRLWPLWSSNVRTTALVLQALLEAGNDFPHVDGCVRWLLARRKNGRWRSTQENAFALQALSTYFEKYEAVSPEFEAEVTLAGREVLKEMFFGRTERQAVREIALSEWRISQRARLQFRKRGPGTLFYGLLLKYIPLTAPPLQQGMHLQKRWEVMEGAAHGDTVAAGSLLKITVTVATPQERHFVVIDDPLPAGFEAVNLRFETESRLTAGRMQRGSYLFNHVEQRDDRVLAFADFLPAGVHRFVYLVRATARGKFAAPAPHAEEMYAPEVFARGRTRAVVIQ